MYLSDWLHTEINVPHRELNLDTVTHSNTNWARRRLTSLIETTTLPLRQTASLLSSIYRRQQYQPVSHLVSRSTAKAQWFLGQSTISSGSGKCAFYVAPLLSYCSCMVLNHTYRQCVCNACRRTHKSYRYDRTVARTIYRLGAWQAPSTQAGVYNIRCMYPVQALELIHPWLTETKFVFNNIIPLIRQGFLTPKF